MRDGCDIFTGSHFILYLYECCDFAGTEFFAGNLQVPLTMISHFKMKVVQWTNALLLYSAIKLNIVKWLKCDHNFYFPS